jgi:hypothetical protein
MSFVAFTPKRPPASAPPPDPAQLYQQLVRGSGAPAGLWTHQDQVLRSWAEDFKAVPDVALELPTGAGKTLVGGLLAEYRRRAASERVVYVCPTRQLARQTDERLTSYGVPTSLLIGQVSVWNPGVRARYTSGQSVAVTVYSHVFNSNSAFGDAQYLVLDDAHAAEGAVASPWSLEVPRKSSAYQDVLALLTSALDPLVLNRLRADDPDGQYLSQVYLTSPAALAAVAGELEDVLRTAVATKALPDAVYALRMMEGHLGRCLLYASYRRLLLRPMIAPTETLPSFSGASQRLYMSATLGSGGELERSFGRRSIKRIPAPDGWDRHGTGRRFFCFPELTTDLAADRAKADTWIAEQVAGAGRAVVLTPDSRTAREFQDRRLPGGMPVLEAGAIEDDLTVFTGRPSAALVLTNRFDGVDLPDNDCRLVVMQGLPARGDLQERFLHGSLGALEVLQERIRARIVQGAGRATRNSGDYAAVMVLGSDLTSFLTRGDVRAALHPEIQAELEFGLEFSLDYSSTEMADNLRVFGEHDVEWRAVESQIIANRETLERQDPPGASELEAAARYEVAAWLAAWQGEWGRALEQARAVLDALRGGRAPQRYAALWHYLAACWSAMLAEETADVSLREASRSHLRDARAAGRGTTWLSHLAAPVDQQEIDTQAVDPLDAIACVNIAAALPELGRPGRFDDAVTAARSGLLATEADPYESGLVYLGRLAGASTSTGNESADAAPDATWVFGAVLWITAEAKSDAETTGKLGANDTRQAGSHLRYVADRRSEPIPSGSIGLVITPQSGVEPSAVAVAEAHVHRVRPATVLDLFDRVVRAWRALRARGGVPTPQDAHGALAAEGALPSTWLPQLCTDPLRSDAG